MKRLIVLLLVIALGAGAWLWLARRGGEAATGFRFVAIERGDVEQVVSATGTVNALTTVEVGTQVSGQIAELYADFNDRVEKGQLVARLDPTLLEQAVRESEASLQRARAERSRAEREARRGESLFTQGLMSESDVESLRSDLEIAQAAETSSRANLERAQRNLAYTRIHSPIDGVVVERAVDVGQTVAASLSAPRLFLIAEDLSQMEIRVAVDESDIGMIEEGQAVRFTVQAYPDRTFDGTVRQVRLQSATLENVVSYTVVVDVDNDGGELLPGMTATVEFLIGRAPDVLRVANAALRFRPTEEMLAALGELREREGAAGGRRPGAEGNGGPPPSRTGRPADRSLLWTVDEQGRPRPVPVQTGISDGQSTAVSGPGIEEGMPIIAGITAGGEDGSSNPFSPNRERTFRPGGF